MASSLLFTFAALSTAMASETATLRWAEGAPGSTFSADDDGKYRYGLWTDDFGVVIAIDSQELEKSRRRLDPVFAVLITVRYRGKESLAVEPDKMTLEFVSHYHDMHGALDPDALAAQFQQDSDAATGQAEREMRKHPEKKYALEAAVRARQQDLSGMIEFLKTRSLRSVTLIPEKPEITGWIFFSAKSKWIGDWRKQEEFVLRMPIKGRGIEFPFALPPSRGDLLLRRRPR